MMLRHNPTTNSYAFQSLLAFYCLAEQQQWNIHQDKKGMTAEELPGISCDFGSGVIVTLPVEKAHQLARQLLANQHDEITLRFN